MKTKIRNLRPDEPVPSTIPRKYKNAKGYIRLRWRVGQSEYVEEYEHRIVMGRPPGHVHHINHVTSDNRPENLVILTEEEHVRLHSGEKTFSHLHEAIETLYRDGASQPDIAWLLRINSSTVSRTLKRLGVATREPKDYANPIPVTLVRTWHAEGVRGDEMRRRLHVGRKRLDETLDTLGLPRFPPGNPRL